MRKIEYIVLHTTAGNQNWSAEDVQRYFLQEKQWKTGGYHWLIEQSGASKRMYEDEVRTNGVLPFANHSIHLSNANAIHISWIGGINPAGQPVDNRTVMQIEAMRALIWLYLEKYPHSKVLGHNQVARKACPCFWVPDLCGYMGVPEENIYREDHYRIRKQLDKYEPTTGK